MNKQYLQMRVLIKQALERENQKLVQEQRSLVQR